MADNKPLTFVLSDESVNSYGFRILTDGIDLSLFEKNPLMLWNHHRTTEGTVNEILPPGKWVNLRKENGKLLGDAVFDESDEYAMRLKRKVEGGFLNMVSVYVEPITTSEDPEVLLTGQTYPTVVECLLKEVSICDIPGNRNSVRLCDSSGREIKLSEGQTHELLPSLKTNKTENTNQMTLQDFATALGLREEPKSDDAVLSAARTMAAEHAEMKKELDQYKLADTERNKTQVTALVDGAINDRKILAADREQYIKLAEANFGVTSELLAKMPATVDLSASAQTEGQNPKAESPWNVRLRETGQIQ